MPEAPTTMQQPPTSKTDCLTQVTLDQGSFTTASAEIEMERHRAVSDLLIDNRFKVVETEGIGPWHLHLGIENKNLIFLLQCQKTRKQEEIALPLSCLSGTMKDYVILVENFYKTAKSGHISQLETLDAGRRSLHDDGADILCERLKNKVLLDKGTARRLFTLIYVLHMRQVSTLNNM